MKKITIFSAIITLTLFVALLGVGIYAAATTTQTSSGTIGFISNDVRANVRCFSGTSAVAVNTEDTPAQTVSFTTGSETVESTWAPSLSFSTNTPGAPAAQAADIVLSFLVTNNTGKTIYGYFVNSSSEMTTSGTLKGKKVSDNTVEINNLVSVTLTGKTAIANGATECLTITFHLNQVKFLNDYVTEAYSYSLYLNSFDPNPAS